MVTKPTINLDGTPPRVLLEQQVVVIEAMRSAISLYGCYIFLACTRVLMHGQQIETSCAANLICSENAIAHGMWP